VPLYKKKHRVTGELKFRWGDDVKLQAAACYVMLGNMREVSAATSIPYLTLKEWKLAQWFKDTCAEIRDEDVQMLDSKIQKVVSKALRVVEDRLERGDYQYDPKTGKAIRIPIKAHIALKVTTDLLHRQERIRSAPQRAEIEKTIDARLSKLAEEFRRFAVAKEVPKEEPTDVVVIQPNVISNIATPVDA
jgi:predicted Holliday junction resolvase-like endonuclease